MQCLTFFSILGLPPFTRLLSPVQSDSLRGHRRTEVKMQTVKIGTRGSALALWQANHVSELLRKAHPGLEVSLEIIKTSGDKIQDVPLAKIGGKGLFVKEIEEALLERRVDLAVHSLKDVPAHLPPELALIAILPRVDPRDALIVSEGVAKDLMSLPQGAKIGTSSLRRQLQLKALRPDFQVFPLRGNVDTRLRKVAEGEYHAIVLAAAGLIRLGWGDRISQTISAEQMLPAVGQGVLGLEGRVDDEQVQRLVAPLHHHETALVASAERGLNAGLSGGCQVPIASYAQLIDDKLWLRALVGSPDGAEVLREEILAFMGSASDAEAVGQQLAQRLLAKGADRLIQLAHQMSS
jgi:hydroxymethylbilane synthase